MLSSSLKRAILRKDPTFSEADHGFRSFGELLRHLEQREVIELSEGSAKGDPRWTSPARRARTMHSSVPHRRRRDESRNGAPNLSGLKNRLRKRDPEFSEKTFGYGGFLQFVGRRRPVAW